MRLPIFVALTAAFAFATPRQDLDGLADKMVNALPAGKPALAVMPIDGDAENAIAEYLVAFLASTGRVTLVERAQFQKALNELAMTQTGMMDDTKAVQVGKELSAKYLVVGSIGNMMGQKRINLRVIETETSQVLTGGSVATSDEDFQKLPKELFGEAGNMSSTIFRSAVAPGWGQFYTNHPVRGSIALVAFLGAAGFMGYSFYQANGYNSDLETFKGKMNAGYGTADSIAIHKQFSQENSMVFDGSHSALLAYDAWTSLKQDAYIKSHDDAQSRAMIGLGVLVGVYALNLVDAALCGSEQKKKVELYFSAAPTSAGIQVAAHW